MVRHGLFNFWNQALIYGNSSMAYPEGWRGDMARALLITLTPILCLLTAIAVLWRHRSRPRLLVHYLGLAYLAG
jgi:hypothetical protein